MPQLFMDPLDLWLDVLGTTLLATAYWVYLNFASKAPVGVKSTFNKSFGYFYLGLGIYALASGLWATATWPLPSSYNLVFSDAWPLFGVALYGWFHMSTMQCVDSIQQLDSG
jgi:Predicted membrane protein